MSPLPVFLSWLVDNCRINYRLEPFSWTAGAANGLRRFAEGICSGCYACCLPVIVLACCAAPAQASIEAMNELSKTDSPRVRWLETHAMHLRGVPAYWREFTSQDPAVQTARSIAQFADRFQRVLALKDSILLSGVRADWHWIAQIQSVPGGSHGRISTLHIDGQALAARTQYIGNNQFPWLTHHARLDFSQDSIAGGRRVTQQIYGASLPVDQITAYVQRNLRDTGWRIEPQLASSAGTDVWHRKASRLFVVSLPLGSGSAVFLNHVE